MNRDSTRLLTSTKMCLVYAVLSSLLGACAGRDAAPREPADGGAPRPPETRLLTTWTVEPEFDAAALADVTTRAWYRQVEVEIAHDRTLSCLPPGTLPEAQPHYPASGTEAACSGVKHYVGRGLNFYVTSLLTLFRVTGDRALLDEVDRVMELARARLRDTDGDGFQNWSWLRHLGKTDFNLKEDSLAHGFIAEVAYVFEQNAAYSSAEHPYGARAEAWLSYLRDDFEGKWVGQSTTRETEGLPVSTMFHPYMEMLRYNVYMAKLFPNDPRYRRMREEMTATVLDEFKTDPTERGDAFVWSHFVRKERVGGDPTICLDFQMGTYPQQTMTAFMDMALEGQPGLSDTEAMQKLSRTLSESVLYPNAVAFMYKDVGGIRHGSMDRDRRKTTVIGGWCFVDAPFSLGHTPTDNFRSQGSYQALSWGFLAAFAEEAQTDLEASEIYRVNEQIYGNPAAGEIAAKKIHIPAAMAFSRLYKAGGYTLAQ